MKLDFNDLLIVPKAITTIKSRESISPFYNKKLPLFTAPMDTVINVDNAYEFFELGFNICLPRNEPIRTSSFVFNSYSLHMFVCNYLDDLSIYESLKEDLYVLIDTANGHLDDILIATKRAKEIYGNRMHLMVGNIANPEAYRLLSEAGADYIRVGIGFGGACLTAKNTGVGYAMASLIKECSDISVTLNKPALILADGGMQSYSDIIKALGLGADFVMLGSILNKALESAGDNYLWKMFKVPQFIAEKAYKMGIPVYKKFRGMSTKEVQKKWGNKTLKTSEGVIRFRRVEYTLAGWTENFISYLRSAMSYTDSLTLSDFIGKVDLIEISENSYKRFNK